MTDFTGLRKHFRVMSNIGLDYCDSGNRGGIVAIEASQRYIQVGKNAVKESMSELKNLTRCDCRL